MKTPTLPRGTTGFYNDKNEWVCTGSQIGRRDTPPEQSDCRLYLRRLPFVDGDYDRGGAYWGAPATVWLAWDREGAFLYRRGDSRDDVKAQIVKQYPLAKFYR